MSEAGGLASADPLAPVPPRKNGGGNAIDATGQPLTRSHSSSVHGSSVHGSAEGSAEGAPKDGSGSDPVSAVGEAPGTNEAFGEPTSPPRSESGRVPSVAPAVAPASLFGGSKNMNQNSPAKNPKTLTVAVEPDPATPKPRPPPPAASADALARMYGFLIKFPGGETREVRALPEEKLREETVWDLKERIAALPIPKTCSTRSILPAECKLTFMDKEMFDDKLIGDYMIQKNQEVCVSVSVVCGCEFADAHSPSVAACRCVPQIALRVSNRCPSRETSTRLQVVLFIEEIQNPEINLEDLRTCVADQISIRGQMVEVVSLFCVVSLVIYVLVEQLDTVRRFSWLLQPPFAAC